MSNSTKHILYFIAFLLLLAGLAFYDVYFKIIFPGTMVKLGHMTIIVLLAAVAWNAGTSLSKMFKRNPISEDVQIHYLPQSFLKETLFVISYEEREGIAELLPIRAISPIGENHGEKYFIPANVGKLEVKKTYDLLKDENGQLYFEQVAVWL